MFKAQPQNVALHLENVPGQKKMYRNSRQIFTDEAQKEVLYGREELLP